MVAAVNISTDGAFGYSEVVSYYASKWTAATECEDNQSSVVVAKI